MTTRAERTAVVLKALAGAEKISDVGDVYTDAKAFGIDATVLVLKDGSAYRLDLFELHAPTTERDAPQALPLELKVKS